MSSIFGFPIPFVPHLPTKEQPPVDKKPDPGDWVRLELRTGPETSPTAYCYRLVQWRDVKTAIDAWNKVFKTKGTEEFFDPSTGEILNQARYVYVECDPDKAPSNDPNWTKESGEWARTTVITPIVATTKPTVPTTYRDRWDRWDDDDYWFGVPGGYGHYALPAKPDPAELTSEAPVLAAPAPVAIPVLAGDAQVGI